MELEEIEQQAMLLPLKERAELAHKLLGSLDSHDEEEIAQQWLEEAARRAKELEEGQVAPISAEAVRKKALALLK